ncbi:hypothetical protein C8R43DRAFT_1022487, partial [Mycena crocata]
RPYMGEATPLHPHDGHHAPDDRRSFSPEAYARGGSMSPESARGGSMSPELVYPRGGFMSPDYAHGQGNTATTEDELVFILAPAHHARRAGRARWRCRDSTRACLLGSLCEMRRVSELPRTTPPQLIMDISRTAFPALFHPSGSFMLSTMKFIRTGLRANPTAGKGDLTVIDVTRRRRRGSV